MNSLARKLLVVCFVTLFSAHSLSVTINMRDANLKAFITDISSITGKTFIIDPRVNANVTVVSNEDLSIDEAYEVFLSVLSVHGYSAVEQDSAVKIIPEINGRQNYTELLSTTTPDDKLVTTTVRPQQTSSVALVTILRPLINSQGHLAIYEPSNTLIIADRASNVRRIEKLIAELDKIPGDRYELVNLKHTSASEISLLAKQIFNENNAGLNANQFNAYAIERNNALLLVGEDFIVARMLDLIKSLDVEQKGSSTLRVFYLKYAEAIALQEVLSSMSANILSSNQSNQIKTSITAHQETNSLIISAEPDVMIAIEDLISQLDIKRAQVLVEAIIVEISDTLSRELGVQFLYSGDGTDTPIASQRFGSPSPDLTAIVGGEVYDTTSGSTSIPTAAGSLLTLDGFAAGVGKYTKGQESFALILSVLRKDTDSNVLSTPSILTMDNEESSIIVGQEIPITTGESLGANNTNPFRTIDRQEVGVKLRVKPQINEGDSIKLDIEQEVSSILGPVAVGASEIVTNLRSLETVVMVEDNQTIVLGGLIDDDVQEAERKIPLLGDIPLLGRLFKSTTTSRTKKNLAIFLKPSIIRDIGDMSEITNSKYNFLKAEQMLRENKGRPTPNLDILEDLIYPTEKNEE